MMTNRNTPKADALLDRYLRQECSPGEEQLIEQWYDNLELDQQDTGAWVESSRARFLNDHMPGKTARPNFQPLKRIAAAAALLLVAGLAWFWLQQAPAGSKTQALFSASTGAAALKQVVLPDSTIVWLNANSTLHWAGDYRKGLRQVQLEGEASFDVRHDTAHPFIVHTADADIRVLGTCFNVATGGPEVATEVALLRGKVAVQLNDKAATGLVLLPGEIASCSVANGILKKQQADVSGAFSWMNGGFTARDMPLRQVLEKLCMKYGYTLQWSDPEGGRKHISIAFAAQGFNSMLESLCFVNHLHYTIKDHQIFIQ